MNKEIIEKMKQAKNVEEMLETAKQSGVELTDEDLDEIAGGLYFAKGGETPDQLKLKLKLKNKKGVL